MRAYPKRLHQSFLALGLAALVAGGSSGCADSQVHAEAPAAPASIAVSLSPVAREPVTRTVQASGTLQPRRQHALSFKVGGVVASVLVEEGARVKKGQVLARLDATEVLAGESQAQQALQKAERDANRARTLRDQNGIARSALDDAETALEVARASAASAAFNLRHTTLLAPCDGVIDQRSVEVGQIVGPGAPLFLLSSAGSKVVRVNLTDRDVLDLALGETARVSLDARPGLPLAAKVTRIATLATPGTGTYEVELAVDDPRAQALPAGLTAKVTLERVEHPVASVPLTALVGGDGDRASVFVLEGNQVKRAPVRIAFLAGERVALAEGLDGVDSVVSAGSSELTDGVQVRVVR